MDNAQFWRLIEDAKSESEGDTDAQAAILQNRLAQFSPQDILAFGRIYEQCRSSAYRWDLWGAADIINDGASDDGFEYFRGWLIAQGEEVYNNALRDPDSLADAVPPDTLIGNANLECEDMLYVAMTAYQERTGTEMPNLASYSEPQGKKWATDKELDTMLPKLAARAAEYQEEE